ncbi:ABC transporter ATP-binding protein [Dethiothermospora halolimnae]|uniref:ABC transporter ATP-binding protein n=1 Tax=Dethiothermospora halolimnae TaxID=3114390 RepID=UPI003CCC182C
MKNIINIENLSFKYTTEDILKSLNLNVSKGSFISILGPNGSGKTTLLKNICNILKPYKGKIFIDNKEINSIKEKDLAKKLAVVHQGTDLEFDFTVYDVAMMGRYPYLNRFQSEGERDKAIVKEALINTSTWHLRDKGINEISGGERQRVMIARALAQNPHILLLDEPISHLDIKHQIDILKLCKKLNNEKQLTIITTLHDINMASRYSDHILLLKDGKIKEMDTPDKVITEKNIEDVYGIKVDLIKRVEDRNPIIVPKAI